MRTRPKSSMNASSRCSAACVGRMNRARARARTRGRARHRERLRARSGNCDATQFYAQRAPRQGPPCSSEHLVTGLSLRERIERVFREGPRGERRYSRLRPLSSVTTTASAGEAGFSARDSSPFHDRKSESQQEPTSSVAWDTFHDRRPHVGCRTEVPCDRARRRAAHPGPMPEPRGNGGPAGPRPRSGAARTGCPTRHRPTRRPRMERMVGFQRSTRQRRAR